MIGVIVVVVIIVWLGVGAASNSFFPTPSSDSNPRPECVVCDKLDAWWAAQDWFGKAIGAAWYAINKAACILKGCKPAGG